MIFDIGPAPHVTARRLSALAWVLLALVLVWGALSAVWGEPYIREGWVQAKRASQTECAAAVADRLTECSGESYALLLRETGGERWLPVTRAIWLQAEPGQWYAQDCDCLRAERPTGD